MLDSAGRFSSPQAVSALSLNVQRLTALPHRRSSTPSLTGAAAHGVPLHTLAKREGGHVGVGVHALLHVAAPHALRAAAGALSTRRPQGTRRPALLGAVVRWEANPRQTLRAPAMLAKINGLSGWVVTH